MHSLPSFPLPNQDFLRTTEADSKVYIENEKKKKGGGNNQEDMLKEESWDGTALSDMKTFYREKWIHRYIVASEA